MLCFRMTAALLCVAGFLYGGQAPGSFAERNPRYRLQPSDVVEVHYRYTPEFDQTITIQPDGFVNLQIVGDLKLQGLTLEQVKTTILEQASRRLKDPEITLVLKDFEKPYFVVGGEVGSPGKFEMRGSVTAVQAIAMAGGFKTASAKHSQVILFRRVGPDLAKTEILDLKAATSTSATEPLADLRPGDLLFVPQNRVSKIERFVKWGNFGVYWNPLYK
jgi:polysaccharide export outer membrane protein